MQLVPQYNSQELTPYQLPERPERIWTDLGMGGQRIEPIQYRGVGVKFGSSMETQQRWQEHVESLLDYQFVHPWGPALLEEALESPGSGNTYVGKGEHQRRVLEGNAHLASVGKAVMLLVLRDQCYGMGYLKGEFS